MREMLYAIMRIILSRVINVYTDITHIPVAAKASVPFSLTSMPAFCSILDTSKVEFFPPDSSGSEAPSVNTSVIPS